jgi:hypothetical protein
MIDVNDFADQRAIRERCESHRFQPDWIVNDRAELLGQNPFRQRCNHRCENIPSVKRRARLGQEIAAVRDMPRSFGPVPNELTPATPEHLSRL